RPHGRVVRADRPSGSDATRSTTYAVHQTRGGRGGTPRPVRRAEDGDSGGRGAGAAARGHPTDRSRRPPPPESSGLEKHGRSESNALERERRRSRVPSTTRSVEGERAKSEGAAWAAPRRVRSRRATRGRRSDPWCIRATSARLRWPCPV